MARLGRTQVQYKLRRPTVVGAAVTFNPLKVVLTDPDRARYLVLQRGGHSKLRPPQKIGPAVVFAPIKTVITEVERPSHYGLQRGAMYKLGRVPVLAAPVAPFMPAAIRTYINDADHPLHFSLQRGTTYKLRPPTVIGAAVVYAATRVKLAQAARSYRRTMSEVRPPATLAVAPPGGTVNTRNLVGVGI